MSGRTDTTEDGETFVPIQCFDLSNGSYRTPFEYRHAMYVMIPSTTKDEDKLVACMKYLKCLADPENATKVRYTPDYITNEIGVAKEPSQEEKDTKGYPGTCDDLCIMNLNFAWVNDNEVLAQTDFDNQETQWETLDWFKNFYTLREEGKFRFPTYGYISEDEQTYGKDVENRMVEFVYTVICCPTADFESTYESSYTGSYQAGGTQGRMSSKRGRILGYCVRCLCKV